MPGYVLTFGYDALSRQTLDSQGWGSISRSFDLAGRVLRTSWWDGFYVDHSRLVTGETYQIRENGATSGPGVLVNIGFDDLRPRTGLVYGNGTTQSYAYDPISRLSSKTIDLAGTANDLTQTFNYNPAHQISQIVRSNDAYAWTAHYNVNRNYTSNGLNQYTATGAITPTYDALGNLTSAGPETYAYTSENLLKSGSAGTSIYYDPVGRLAEYDTTVSTRFMSDGPHLAVEVDNPAGNVLRAT